MTTTDQPSPEAKPKDEKSYRGTLNLPKTPFPMKANLVQNEPASIKRWDKLGLYGKLRDRDGDRPNGRWVFHDGPPYANGALHLGHVLNKSLKDFVVRSKTMAGFDVPYVPGWDCHGLPIEHKVMTGLVESGKAARLAELDHDQAAMAVRRACAQHAEKHIKLQKGQMQRLMTLADYDDPYLTMAPDFERRVLWTLADLVEQGLVFRALKPVHWSVDNQTALADAELEYEDREDLSVYVEFVSADADAVYAAFGVDEAAREAGDLGASPSFMIWTTTPWTLPANLAVAVNHRYEYALARVDGTVTVVAKELLERVTEAAKSEDVEVLATAPGERLVGLKYRHPFVDEPAVGRADDGVTWTVLDAEYVTLEDGTGLVHTAPGHGTEDFQTGQRVGLGVYCPVQGDGTYDDSVPEWLAGRSIWEANEEIAKRLRDSGHMFHDHRFMHSYPHDWRSKGPVIFRCTEQWFVGVDLPAARDGKTLREMALHAVDPEAGEGAGWLGFVPAWGRNRMRGMLESRPDWCISRQRSWGLPIPAFTRPDGRVLMTAASARAVAGVIGREGSDAWYTMAPAELLAGYDPAGDPAYVAEFGAEALDTASLAKGADILDVWFESGSTWNAVLRERSGDSDFPVELYLEGADQHRGWFQTSMLCALGSQGRPPMNTILTHGFTVDRDGKKLSKSRGDSVEDLFKKYGADVIRWWVASLPYEGDMKVDDDFFKLAGESYRKVRNTVRFLLSNLGGVGPGALGSVDVPAASIDAWALGAYNRVRAEVIEAYGRYNFRVAQQALYDFCNNDLSAVYLAATKDRLYCDAPGSERRVRTQAVMHAIADGVCRLLAPVLCHTADEAYRVLHGAGKDDAGVCVHLEPFGPALAVSPDARWGRVMGVVESANQALERAKSAEDALENPLDAGLVLGNADGTLDGFDPVDLADLCGVSLVELDPGVETGSARVVDRRDEPRCMRSWKRDGTVRGRSDGGLLSDRDAAAIGLA